MEKHYLVVYWMQSNLVHSGITSMNQYMKDEERGVKVNCSPKPSDEIRIPIVATQHFLDVMWHTIQALGLNLHADCSNALAKFTEIVDGNARASKE